MKIRSLVAVAAFGLLVPGAYAQKYVGDGYINRQVEFGLKDLHKLSQLNQGMGTARSAAMGGAFASLGADMSAMSINPAGLGMFRSTSEFSVTAGLNMNGYTNNMQSAGEWTANRTSGSLNNIGVTLNGYEGMGGLTSLTWGIGYTQLADFNYRSTIDAPPAGMNSEFVGIGDFFGWQLNGYTPKSLDTYDPRGTSIYDDEWGAWLGYKTGLVASGGVDNSYYVPGVGDNALIAQYMNTISKGNMGEFTLSMGMNFRNTFYLGFTLGAMNIFHDREIWFEENYSNNSEVAKPLRQVSYSQRLRTYGDGFNFKVGMIFRPMPELRVGLAVHSPTWTSIETRYSSDMATAYDMYGVGGLSMSTPNVYFSEKYRTPARLLAGISGTIGNMAIITADYDCTWYNGIRLRGDLYGMRSKDDMASEVKTYMAPAHSFRVGAEFKPTAELSLRAGYAYSGSGWNDDVNNGRVFFDTPVELDSNTYSAGLGYRFGGLFSLDLVYLYSKMNYSEYDLYYMEIPDAAIVSGYINPERNRHSVMLSFGLRF
ncbi:outer membrane protein transport protein [Alistipes sp. OttesenSCG-928-B03]|nr:outer membrane protein transport protein [Alistipes sp. OttesenSCG-928-B03]